MANLLNRVSFLEKKLNTLKYQLELNQSYPEIVSQKLKACSRKKIEDLQEKENRELYRLEIETLDNPTYLKFMTEDQIKHLETKCELSKRKAVTSYYRKTGNQTPSAALDQALAAIELRCTNEKNALIKLHQARSYDQNLLSTHVVKYQTALTSHQERMALYAKHLEEEKEHQLTLLKQSLHVKALVLTKKIEQTQAALKLAQAKDQSNPSTIDMPADVILKIDHLTMQFGGLKAVDDLSFEVKKGEIFGLIGPNGAGKTTVFNCITQFYKPTKGTMLYQTRLGDVVTLNKVKVHDVIKQGIVRTFQNVELIWELSILDNMLVGAHSKYRSKFFDHSFQTRRFKREESIIKAKAEKILFDLGLLPYQHFYPLGLPYGVLKKIELARTLMTNPSLIILDEPAAGLNDSETEQLAHTIKKIQKDYDTTIFLVEHDMGLVMSICDTICAISFGKKLAIGTPQVIQKDPVVQQAYLGGE
jgi:branched-chain amino acid transport system ATP-binding protein